MTAILVTGTDTGVGKTVVTAALTLAWRARGRRVWAFKPAETGVAPGESADSDVLRLACGRDEPLCRPLLRLPEPLAPAVAASRAGISVEPREFVERIARLRSLNGDLLVEGAGGVLVPLVRGFTVLDLAATCGLEVLIVARAGLGTLNHTLLTALALRQRGVALRAVVLNGVASPPTVAEATNPDVLREALPGVPVLVLPQVERGSPIEVARLLVPQLDGLGPTEQAAAAPH